MSKLYRYLALMRAECLLSLPLLAGSTAGVISAYLKAPIALSFIVLIGVISICYILTKLSWPIVTNMWKVSRITIIVGYWK